MQPTSAPLKVESKHNGILVSEDDSSQVRFNFIK